MSEETKKTIPTDLPSNSYSNPRKDSGKVEEVRPDIKPVIKGEVIKKKRGFGSKLRETFSGDDSKTVGDYVLFEVLVPNLKSMLSDATKEAIDRLLFGSGGNSRTKTIRGNGNPTSYSTLYGDSGRGSGVREVSKRGRATHNFDEIIIADRAEAEEVLDQLATLIEDFGQAKVSDLYTMVGISGSYIDDRWGWTNISTATTSRVRQGYLLDLPAPITLR